MWHSPSPLPHAGFLCGASQKHLPGCPATFFQVNLPSDVHGRGIKADSNAILSLGKSRGWPQGKKAAKAWRISAVANICTLWTLGLVQHQRAACGARDEIALPTVSTFQTSSTSASNSERGQPLTRVSEPCAATLDVQIRPQVMFQSRLKTICFGQEHAVLTTKAI